MKHLFQFFLISILFIATSCKKDKLPEPTTTGKETLGCKVNGNLFVAQRLSMFQSVEPLKANVYRHDGTLLLYIYGTDYTLDGNPTIKLVLVYEQMQKGVKYSLQELHSGIASAQYSQFDANHNDIEFNSSPNLYGEIELTHLDRDGNIVAGTFSFDAENSEGEKVTVREGRFDLKYGVYDE